MRVTCDANLPVRAALHVRGLARQVLELSAAVPHTLVTSPAILADVHRVLLYPHIQKRYGIPAQDIDDFVRMVLALSDVVLTPNIVPVVAADPDDDVVIATAVDGSVEVIATRDQHFFDPTVQAYCAPRGIRIVTDIDLVAELRQALPPVP